MTEEHITIVGVTVGIVSAINGAIFSVLYSMVKGIQATLSRDHVHRDEFTHLTNRVDVNSGRLSGLEAQVKFLTDRLDIHVSHD